MIKTQRKAIMSGNTVQLDIYKVYSNDKLANIHEKYSIHDGKYLCDRKTEDRYDPLVDQKVKRDIVYYYEKKIKNGYIHNVSSESTRSQVIHDSSDDDKRLNIVYNTSSHREIKVNDTNGNTVLEKHYDTFSPGVETLSNVDICTYDECSRLIYRKYFLFGQYGYEILEEYHDYKQTSKSTIHTVKFYCNRKYTNKTIVKVHNNSSNIYTIEYIEWRNLKKNCYKVTIDDTNNMETSINVVKKGDVYFDNSLIDINNYLNKTVVDRLTILDIDVINSLSMLNNIRIRYSDKENRIPLSIVVYDPDWNSCIIIEHVVFDQYGIPILNLRDGEYVKYDMNKNDEYDKYAEDDDND